MKKIFKLLIFIAAAPALNAQSLPPGLLGGMLKSDSWVIRKDLQQEEFKGNVSYDSALYKLKADHALSDRAKNTFTLNGKVYLYNKTADGNTAELYSQSAFYNTAKKTAVAKSGKTPLKLIYDTPGFYTITAQSKTLNLNLAKNHAQLNDNVKIKYETDVDFTLAFADKATINRAQNTALLEGNVEIDNKEYSVLAGKVFLDNNTNLLEVEGNYPLITADLEDANLAMQSDKIVLNTLTKKANASGRVSGWISPK